MVNIAYMQTPDAPSRSAFRHSAIALRHHLATVGAQGTPWGHIWTVHLPDFLDTWGTLYPFICHPIEGFHRFLKADLRLTYGGTLGRDRHAGPGFALTLKLNVASWNLSALPQRPQDLHRYKADRSRSGVTKHKAYRNWLKQGYATFLLCAHCKLVSTAVFAGTFLSVWFWHKRPQGEVEGGGGWGVPFKHHLSCDQGTYSKRLKIFLPIFPLYRVFCVSACTLSFTEHRPGGFFFLKLPLEGPQAP